MHFDLENFNHPNEEECQRIRALFARLWAGFGESEVKMPIPKHKVVLSNEGISKELIIKNLEYIEKVIEEEKLRKAA